VHTAWKTTTNISQFLITNHSLPSAQKDACLTPCVVNLI
jgi:hypothetical protein